MIDPKILKRMLEDERGWPVALSGSKAQVKWAETIRRGALALHWPHEVRCKLNLITDSTWFIANRDITTTMKFKEPSPKQVTGCSSIRPAAESSAEQEEPPEEEERPHSSPAAPSMIPPRTAAAQKLHDFEDRVSDAERWAESVSHTPKLAEAAILAVLSRLYKDPMKARLRGLAERKMVEAVNAIEKDKDAIRRMLQ
jgi:hypothetical protein